MQYKKFLWPALALGVLASCSDSKDDDVIDEPKGEMEVMTPEESKTYLQNTATEFLDLFKPEEQKEIVELASYFDEEYGEYAFPDLFDDDDNSVKSYLRDLSRGARGDLDALTRSSEVYTYRLNFKNLAGIYEPDAAREEWVKKADSSDLIFRFNNKGGQSVELKVVQSGGTSEVEFNYVESWTDYWSDYDPATDTWTEEEMEEKYQYFLSIPKNVTVTLTEAGKQLAQSTAVTSIDTKGHKMSADLSASLANLSATAKVDADDSKVTANCVYSMNGKEVAKAQATLNGHNLCDISKYEALASSSENENEDEVRANILSGMVEKGECAGDILGKVQVYGNVTYYKTLFEDCNAYFEYPNSKETAKLACDAVCDRLNKNLSATLRYDGTKTDQASLLFRSYLEEWGDYDYGWEYYPEAVLLFPDKTTYSFESYFEKFTNVSNKFDTVLDAYMSLWDTVRRK